MIIPDIPDSRQTSAGTNETVSRRLAFVSYVLVCRSCNEETRYLAQSQRFVHGLRAVEGEVLYVKHELFERCIDDEGIILANVDEIELLNITFAGSRTQRVRFIFLMSSYVNSSPLAFVFLIASISFCKQLAVMV